MKDENIYANKNKIEHFKTFPINKNINNNQKNLKKNLTTNNINYVINKFFNINLIIKSNNKNENITIINNFVSSDKSVYKKPTLRTKSPKIKKIVSFFNLKKPNKLNISKQMNESSSKILSNECDNNLNQIISERLNTEMNIIKDKKNYYDMNNEIDKYYLNGNDFLIKKDLIEDNKNLDKQKELKELFNLNCIECKNNKKFGYFYGFNAISYKNGKLMNNNKLNININILLNKKLKVQKNNVLNFFSIFDGFDDDLISNYLNDNFLEKLLSFNYLKLNPIKALENTITSLLNNIEKNIKFSNSKSSILVLLNIEKNMYILNMGENQSIYSTKFSEKFINLSNINNNYFSIKLSKYFKPNILNLKLNKLTDFIILGNSSLFKFLNKNEISLIVYQTLKKGILEDLKIEEIIHNINKNIIFKAIEKNCIDNLSIIFLETENFLKIYTENLINYIDGAIIRIKNYMKENIENKFYNITNKNINEIEKNESQKNSNKKTNEFISDKNINNNINNNKKNNVYKKKGFKLLKLFCFSCCD